MTEDAGCRVGPSSALTGRVMGPLASPPRGGIYPKELLESGTWPGVSTVPGRLQYAEQAN